MTAHDGLVIFDCDGVLIDSESIAARTISETLVEFNVTMTQREALDAFVGQSEKDVRADLRERGLDDYDKFAVVWREQLYKAFAKDLEPIQGIEALIEEIGSPVCVASNSSHDRLKRSLGTTSLWQLFGRHVFSAEDVANPKPAPDLVQHCLSRFNALPEKSLMIDDSRHGIMAAKAAGVTPIGFIDPNDPRQNRQQVLEEAGAEIIATGAAGLFRALKTLSVPFRSPNVQNKDL